MRGIKPNHTPYPIEQILKHAKDVSKIPDRVLSDIFKTNRCTENTKINRNDLDWRLGDLFLHAVVLGVDEDELMNAIRKDYRVVYESTNKKYIRKR